MKILESLRTVLSFVFSVSWFGVDFGIDEKLFCSCVFLIDFRASWFFFLSNEDFVFRFSWSVLLLFLNSIFVHIIYFRGSSGRFLFYFLMFLFFSLLICYVDRFSISSFFLSDIDFLVSCSLSLVVLEFSWFRCLMILYFSDWFSSLLFSYWS